MATKQLANVRYEDWQEKYKVLLQNVVKTKIEEAVANAVPGLIEDTINKTAEQKVVEELTGASSNQGKKLKIRLMANRRSQVVLLANQLQSPGRNILEVDILSVFETIAVYCSRN